MPVKGNEEPGVLSRQTSICYAGIPIKKRRFPMIPPPSPPREEPPPSLPEKNNVKDKEESSSGKERCLNANLAIDSTNKPDVGKDLLKEVKKETPPEINVNPVKTDLSGSGARETSPATCPGSVNNIDRKVQPLLTENPASPIVPGSNPVFSTLNVKKQIISNQVTGDFKLELSAGSGNAELSLGSKEQLVSASGHKQSEGSSQMPDKIDPSLLILSLSKENPVTESNSRDSGLTTASVHVGAIRSNWDLNTTMDAWESSVKDASVKDAAVNDNVGIDGLNKTSSTHDVKPFLSSTSVVGVAIDKGKQIVDPFEKSSNFCMSSMSPNQQYKSEDSLHLSLSTSFPELDLSREYSASSTKMGFSRIMSDSNLQKPITNTSSSGCRTVKPEPVDQNLRLDSLQFNGSPMGSLDLRLVKRETVERHCVEAGKMLSSEPQRLVEPRPVKSEVGQEGNQESRSGTNVIIHQPIWKVVQRQESCSSSSTIVSMPMTPQQLGSSILPNCSELSASGGLPNQSEHSLHTNEVHSNEDTMDRPAADMISEPVSHMGIEPNVSDCKVNPGQAEELNVEDSVMFRLKRSEELNLGLHATAERSISDEEKINISTDMLEEDAYGSDYESDGDHSVGGQVDMEDEQCGKEDNEYEDGEVREPLIHSSVEDPTFEIMETENVKHADNDTKLAHHPIGLPGDCSTDQFHADEKQSEIEIHNETNRDYNTENIGAVTNVNSDQLLEDEFSMQKSLSDKATAVGADERRPEKAPLNQSGERDVLEANRKDFSGDGATSENCGTVTAVSEVTGEIVQGTNAVGNADSSLSKAETSLDGHDAAKESVTGGNRSRIINLSRASNVTSPSRIRSIPGRSLSLRGGRERYSDIGRDNSHLRGNRDNIHPDVPNKFTRDRIQDQSFRSSRLEFMRGRGRVSGRLDTLRGEWDPDHDFASKTFDGPADYRFARHKRASVITGAGLECNDFVVASNGAAMGASRGGRKPLNEELYSFRHPSSRRISPGARDVPLTRNIQMLHRLPRNIGEAGSDLAGLRHEKKFMRGLPDDMTNSLYTRPQAAYEELDGQFVRGNRKFSNAQRRGFPRVRSKSPINTRPRSPGSWTSPRRRLTDGFNALSDQTQHRSPAMYRVDRMRSPDRVCYTEEMGSRRHVSPTYVARPSNDIRDIDSARGRGHIRSINSSRRSPSDRVFPRSTRRLDVDPRERAGGDDYFSGPIHAGRFHEFRGEGSSDERKKFGERRSPVRSFRPTYSGNSEGYCFDSEDGSRPLRFCPDQDTEIFERSNIRERDFDGLMKSRPLIAQRRIRSIEEQEGNYRQTGQIWHDDAFNDDSRLKRRRF